MIIGGGLLATKFLERKEAFENHIIFASGVSDSSETDESAYHREIELVSNLIDENPNLFPVYFSCILIDGLPSRYYKHKLEMEKLIKSKSDRYIIFRVPQIVGRGGNKNNLFNFFRTSIINKDTAIVYSNVERSIIDIDDLVEIVKYCMWDFQATYNISNIEKINALDLYNKIALGLNITPSVSIRETENNNNWIVENSPMVNRAIKDFEIQREGYTDKVIQKYIR
jgi:nucleoside-diphosphate-sugar epimerase